MEVWTFIHKNTNEIIRFDILEYDEEFGDLYYFINNDYSPIWFVNTEEESKLAYQEFIHPLYNSYNRPSTDKINIYDYKISKFILYEN